MEELLQTITQLVQKVDELVTAARADYEEKVTLLNATGKKNEETTLRIQEEKKALDEVSQNIQEQLSLIEQEKTLDHDRKIIIEKKEKELEERIASIQNMLKA